MNEMPSVRVDGVVAPGGTFSAPLDWNDDLIAPDAVNPPGIDVNFNGLIDAGPFSGFDDWQMIDLQQIGGRENAFGFSGGGVKFGGGGVKFGGGGVDNDGGGVKFGGGGVKFGGGGVKFGGGGIDQDEDAATSTADAPVGLACNVSGCVVSSGSPKGSKNQVSLLWTAPGFGQIRSYTIWRALGSFPTTQAVLSHVGSFSVLTTLTGAPPSASYIDSNVKNNTTYTYFVTDANKQGAQSRPSNPLVVTVK